MPGRGPAVRVRDGSPKGEDPRSGGFRGADSPVPKGDAPSSRAVRLSTLISILRLPLNLSSRFSEPIKNCVLLNEFGGEPSKS
jgi:hypothetical protein